MLRKILALMAVTATAPMAFASGAGEKHVGGDGVTYLPGGALTYDVFEASVDHADLADCPAEFDPDVVFCRLTLAAEAAHVFVFELDGDQRLLAVKNYALDGEFLPF